MSIDSNFYAQRMTHRTRRGDQLERQACDRREERAIAQAVAGPEVIATDGGEPAEIETNDVERLHVGDHVTDRDDPDSTMLVVGLPVASADEYQVAGKTIAAYNPDYPADDDVIEVVYPQRTDVDIRPIEQYAFPRSRLSLETPIHDRDDVEGGDA